MTPTLETGVVLERVSLDDVPEPEWDALAGASGNVFATRAWLSTWWRHFGAGRELVCYSVRRADGSLGALLPLYAWRSRPLRVLRFLGHPMGGRLGPISSPPDRPLAATALEHVLSAARFDVFVGEGLEGGARWPALLGQPPWRRTPSPRLALRFRSWQEFLASRSANFRQELRRKERRLAEQHDVRFRLAVDEDRLHRDLDTLFHLHRVRWGKPTPFSAAEAFHRAFAVECFRRGWLRLWLLEVEGGPVAALYGFRFAGTEYYFQAGRDPRWQRLSPGLLLLAHAIRAALEDGMEEYDLGHGGGEYKYRFAGEDPGREDVIWAGSLRGRAALWLLAAAQGMPQVRRALRGRLES